MRDTSSSRIGKLLILPCLALSAGGYLFGLSFEEGQLAAAPLGSADLDGDGLVDVQESILKTNAFAADSDGDGYSDLEEFSRGSDPTLITDIPVVSNGSVAMTGRVQSGVFRAVTALYVPGGSLVGASVSFGALIGGTLVPLDPLLLFAGANLSIVPTGTGSDAIYLLETPIPESLVLALGNSAIYATYSPPGATTVETASAINLMAINGVVTQITGGTGGTGTTYRPLSDDPDIPATWTPAQVCVQNLSTVGVVGAVLQQQVDSAACESLETNAYCPPDCSNLTGTTQEIIDPLGLIGG
jgi:hypothetical protein